MVDEDNKDVPGKGVPGKDVPGSVSGCLGCFGQILLMCLAFYTGSHGPRLALARWPGPITAAIRWLSPPPPLVALETPDGVYLTVSGDRMGPAGIGVTTLRIDHWARRRDCDAMPGSFEITHSSAYAWIRRSPGPNGTVWRFTSKHENRWAVEQDGPVHAAGSVRASPRNLAQIPHLASQDL